MAFTQERSFPQINENLKIISLTVEHLAGLFYHSRLGTLTVKTLISYCFLSHNALETGLWSFQGPPNEADREEHRPI